MAIALHIILTIFCFINLLLHSLGIYTLQTTYKKSGNKSIQLIYLLNLSANDIVACILTLMEDLPELFSLDVSQRRTLKEIEPYQVILIYLVLIWYYWDMVLLTADRLLAITLGIKYPIYWNKRRAKIVVGLTWFALILTSIIVCIVYRVTYFTFRSEVTLLHIQGILNFGFIIFIVCTYAYIFHQFKKSRRNAAREREESGNAEVQVPSTWAVFRSSRFYVSVLLVITFALFMVIPNLVGLFHGIYGNLTNETREDIIKIFYQLSFFTDAIIYIFLRTDVRSTLLDLFNCCRCRKPKTEVRSRNEQIHENDTSL